MWHSRSPEAVYYATGAPGGGPSLYVDPTAGARFYDEIGAPSTSIPRRFEYAAPSAEMKLGTRETSLSSIASGATTLMAGPPPPPPPPQAQHNGLLRGEDVANTAGGAAAGSAYATSLEMRSPTTNYRRLHGGPGGLLWDGGEGGPNAYTHTAAQEVPPLLQQLHQLECEKQAVESELVGLRIQTEGFYRDIEQLQEHCKELQQRMWADRQYFGQYSRIFLHAQEAGMRRELEREEKQAWAEMLLQHTAAVYDTRLRAIAVAKALPAATRVTDGGGAASVQDGHEGTASYSSTTASGVPASIANRRSDSLSVSPRRGHTAAPSSLSPMPHRTAADATSSAKSIPDVRLASPAPAPVTSGGGGWGQAAGGRRDGGLEEPAVWHQQQQQQERELRRVVEEQKKRIEALETLNDALKKKNVEISTELTCERSLTLEMQEEMDDMLLAEMQLHEESNRCRIEKGWLEELVDALLASRAEQQRPKPKEPTSAPSPAPAPAPAASGSGSSGVPRGAELEAMTSKLRESLVRAVNTAVQNVWSAQGPATVAMKPLTASVHKSTIQLDGVERKLILLADSRDAVAKSLQEVVGAMKKGFTDLSAVASQHDKLLRQVAKDVQAELVGPSGDIEHISVALVDTARNQERILSQLDAIETTQRYLTKRLDEEHQPHHQQQQQQQQPLRSASSSHPHSPSARETEFSTFFRVEEPSVSRSASRGNPNLQPLPSVGAGASPQPQPQPARATPKSVGGLHPSSGSGSGSGSALKSGMVRLATGGDPKFSPAEMAAGSSQGKGIIVKERGTTWMSPPPDIAALLSDRQSNSGRKGQTPSGAGRSSSPAHAFSYSSHRHDEGREASASVLHHRHSTTNPWGTDQDGEEEDDDDDDQDEDVSDDTSEESDADATSSTSDAITPAKYR